MRSARKRIAIIGAGGFARELAWLIRERNRDRDEFEFAGFVVSDLSRITERDSRDLIVGNYEWLVSPKNCVDAVAIGIGTPSARLKVAAELDALLPGIEAPVLIHPGVRFDCASTTFGRGVILCVGVVATVNIVFGDFTVCQFGCTVGHETRIGRGSAINPGANISGGVVIGDGVLVGTGAQILQYINIGDRATVGAGAVVTRDVEAGVTVVGVPARNIHRAF